MVSRYCSKLSGCGGRGTGVGVSTGGGVGSAVGVGSAAAANVAVGVEVGDVSCVISMPQPAVEAVSSSATTRESVFLDLI
jgi:hypothetical protein